MTREEARAYIIRHCNPDYPNGKTEWETAINMAIEALSREPSEDVISRRWLMECVNEGWIKFETEKDKNIFIHLVRDIAPSAQPKTMSVILDVQKITKHKSDFSDLPSAQPRSFSCGQGNDLISRQAVKEWLARWEGYIDTDIIARMQCRVIDIPSAKPKPLKYSGTSICCYCKTTECGGCLYEPMAERREE